MVCLNTHVSEDGSYYAKPNRPAQFPPDIGLSSGEYTSGSHGDLNGVLFDNVNDSLDQLRYRECRRPAAQT